MSSKIRIGVVGLGEVTQTLHLPTLQKLSEQFAVTAAADVSASTAHSVGAQWHIPFVAQDYQSVVARDDVDAILVSASTAVHAQVLLAALVAGKHVFIEKPYCVTLAEADLIADAERASGRVVQVGFMRNFSPALAAAKKDLANLGPVRFARVHDVIGSNRIVVDQVRPIARGTDLSPEQIDSHKILHERQMRAALGESATPADIQAYGLMIGLASHDLSAMSYLFGNPRSVLHAKYHNGGRFITAVLGYETFEVLLSIGADKIPRYDTYIEIFGDSAVAKVVYNTPYIANLPQTLHTTRASQDGMGVIREVAQPNWGDAFDAEWRAFHATVTTGAPNINTTAQARANLHLISEIAAFFRPE